MNIKFWQITEDLRIVTKEDITYLECSMSDDALGNPIWTTKSSWTEDSVSIEIDDSILLVLCEYIKEHTKSEEIIK